MSEADSALEWGADGLAFGPEPLFVGLGQPIADYAALHQLPSISGSGAFPANGGLFFYGPRVRDNFPRAAGYVDRILRGAKPADLPIEQPREFDLIVNLRTAQALGLTIPQHVLLQATELIQ